MSIASKVAAENKRIEGEAKKEFALLMKKYKDVLDTSSGRDVVWDILGMCGIYDNKFHTNSTTFFEEGKRAIGLEVLGRLNDLDPKVYPQMMIERIK